MSVDTNTWRETKGLSENVSMGSSIFYLTKCFMCILYISLITIILFLLFTVHFYDKDFDLMAFLSLHEDFLINSKFPDVVRFLTHVCLFCSLLFFISVILLVLSGDIEANPGPHPGHSNSFPFCHRNLNSIAAHNFIKMQDLYCKLTTPYISLMLSVYQKTI